MKLSAGQISWLNQNKIYNFTFDERGRVCTNSRIKIITTQTKLLVRFGVVSYFDCSDAGLTNLSGSPIEANVYICSNNNFLSLRGAPKKTGEFICVNNRITNLLHAPESLYYIISSCPYLESLEGISNSAQHIICTFNPMLKSLGHINWGSLLYISIDSRFMNDIRYRKYKFKKKLLEVL